MTRTKGLGDRGSALGSFGRLVSWAGVADGGEGVLGSCINNRTTNSRNFRELIGLIS